MATQTIDGKKIVFSNSGAAVAETWATSDASLNTTLYFDVLSQDGGGKAKSLWSIGTSEIGANGWTTQGGIRVPTELLARDTAYNVDNGTYRSKLGANIFLTGATGLVGYDMSAMSDTIKAQVVNLAVGQSLTDSFDYAIRLSNGTLSWNTVTLVIYGAPATTRVVRSGTTVSGGGFANGSTEIVNAGGTATNAVIGNGGFQDVFGSASGTLIFGGGRQTVEFRGTARATVLDDNAVQTVYGSATGTIVGAGNTQLVEPGGVAVGTMIDTGGSEIVLSGGLTTDTTISAGGLLELSAGALTSGTIFFVGTGGVLQIDGTTMPTSPISGFARGDQIDLRAVAPNGGNSVSFDPATGILTVHGTVTETLTLSGIASGTTFMLLADGSGGTLIEKAPYASTITRASTDANGHEANSGSYVPVISADGRYVAFHSYASNLVPGDTNGNHDVFMKDLQTGAITRASTAADGAEAIEWESYAPSISSDGHYVAFFSWASNLVGDDTNGVYDVFVKDMQTGAITRASTDAAGIQGNDRSIEPSISGDGRYVAFYSIASNLVGDDTNGVYDVFVKDMQTGAISRVSTDAAGGEANGSSSFGAISAGGSYIAFSSGASNLVGDDTNGTTDVFVKNLESGAVTRVSTGAAGTEGNGWSEFPAISADGRYIVFSSDASNLVGDDTNGTTDVFVKDLWTGAITRVSTDAAGREGNDSSPFQRGESSAISADGRYVAFASWASNLVPDDTNGKIDVFVKDVQTGRIIRVSPASAGGEPAGLPGYSYFPSLSADGRYVSFYSDGSDLVADDTNGTTDVFVVDLTNFIAGASLTAAPSATLIVPNGDLALTALTGPEVFDFSSVQFGHDTIVGFDPARDTIQLNHALAGNFAAVQADMSSVAGGTLITFDSLRSITLSDVVPGGLTVTNFRFV